MLTIAQAFVFFLLQRQAEDDIRKLSDIIHASDDAIVLKDERGHITSWNRGAVNTFGYSSDEMLGNTTDRLLPSGCVDEAKEVKFSCSFLLNYYKLKKNKFVALNHLFNCS